MRPERNSFSEYIKARVKIAKKQNIMNSVNETHGFGKFK